jgi:quercetin dioxygenase-like cupin family protein
MSAVRTLTQIALLALVSCASSTQVGASSPAHLQIARAGSQIKSTGAPANFTGQVVITSLFQPTANNRAAGASVAFDPGSRSAWHTHPAGQTLIITAGTGWVQEWNGAKQEVHSGDVIWTPAGVKHWHGATSASPMTHIAVQENVDGKVVEWLELVSETDYQR